jgi:hypothetical protein|tara:strand:- start:2078 stop:2359 length:282 start_codon:yes stop_codon:yes gene_type:complete
MRYQKDFGFMLAFALAIRRRDEVAVKQFASKVGNQLIEQFEIGEAAKLTPVRSSDGRKRQDERLNTLMAEETAILSRLVDPEGMEWLRSQIEL